MTRLIAALRRTRSSVLFAASAFALAACDPSGEPGGAYYDGVLWHDYYWDRCPPYCGPGRPEDPPRPIQPLPPERPVQPLPKPRPPVARPPVARPLPARPPISRPGLRR